MAKTERGTVGRRLRVAGYTRVSSDEQRERQTILTQTEYLTTRAKLEGWDLTVFADDGVTGTLPLAQRPQGARLLSGCRAGDFDLVATTRVDRVGRTLRVTLDAIDELGDVPYKSLTEPFDTATPLGKAMLHILAVFAELERETFLERSRAGTERVAKQDHRWLGGIVPYGYVKTAAQMLVVDDEPLSADLKLSPAGVVRLVFHLCANEAKSTRTIAAELNARKIPTSYAKDAREHIAGDIQGTRGRDGKRRRTTAGTWTAGAVLRLLRSETYTGIHRYGRRSKRGRETVARAMPLIVEPSLAEKASMQLALNFAWDRANPKHPYPLAGVMTCTCGHALIGTFWKAGGKHVRAYKCSAHPVGTDRPMRVYAEDAEAAIWTDIERFLDQPSELLAAIARESANASDAEERAESELLTLSRDVRDLEGQEQRAVELSLTGAVTPAVMERTLTGLHERMAKARARISAVRRDRSEAASQLGDTEQARALLATLAQAARTAPDAARAQVIRALVKGAHASWRGEETRLMVTYGFPAPTKPVGGDDSNRQGFIAAISVKRAG